MKKILILIFGILSCLHIQAQNGNLKPRDKEILMAMRDELKRNLTQIKLDNLKSPYFIEYSFIVSNPLSIEASLGSLNSSRLTQNANLSVGIRVGDYSFDNTNFFDVGLSFFGSGDDEERFKKRTVAVNSDYNLLRREFWLATDAAYKQSAEIFSKKESSLKNKLRKDTLADFAKMKPFQKYNYIDPPHLNSDKIEEYCISASAEFLNYKNIHSSSVVFEYIPKIIYYVNSEGTEYIRADYYAGFEMVASTQALDGMPLYDFYSCYNQEPNSLPTKDSIISAAKILAENTNNLFNSKPASEAYTGPILFDGQAACELIAQDFAPNLVAQRPTQSESGVQDNERSTAFQNKIGARVLPEFISVDSKPTQNKYLNVELLGNYFLDDDGVEPIDTTIVKDGYLKTLLASRIPTKKIKESNGNKRGGAPMFSNLEFNVNSTHSVSYDSLKNKLIELIKKRDLPFGIIIKKIINQNILYTSLYRASYGSLEFPRGEGNFMIAEAYKIDKNGNEQLIRGFNGAGFTSHSFKDIILCGKDKYCLNFLASSVISSFISGGDQYIGASVISPDLLFEDAELRTIEEDFKKPPLISSPLSDK